MTPKRILVVLAAIGLVWSAPQARAQRASPMQAGRFMQICTNPRGQPICDAYITGMADSLALVQAMAAKSTNGDVKLKPVVCIPRQVTGEAMRGSVVSWLSSHRDRLRDQVGEAVYLALHESYPCNGGTSGGG